MTTVEAVRLLRSPRTTCQGAAALARLGDRSALVDLQGVHGSLESSSARRCVKRAMARLGAAREASRLASSADPGERHVGIAIMELFRSADNVPVLAAIVTRDPDAGIRSHATNALWLQPRDASWEQIMIELLDHDDAAVRRTAAMALTGQWGEPVLAALRRRLAREPIGAVREKLEAAVREHEGRAARPASRRR
jgi:hypothetical protein